MNTMNGYHVWKILYSGSVNSSQAMKPYSLEIGGTHFVVTKTMDLEEATKLLNESLGVGSEVTRIHHAEYLGTTINRLTA